MKIFKNIQISLFVSTLLVSIGFANDTHSLKTVTVTAQKSEEDVQKVPISISVFDEDSIKDSSISTLDDIDSLTPSLMFFNTGQQGLTAPSIRGIYANVVSFSTPVSLYVDGVPTMSSFGYADGLLDVERIEVLKGPQGTLYGKNSEVGVINIITKKPDNDFRGKLFTTLGSDGKREYGVNISGPIIKDKFYAGIAYKHDEKDGYIKNANTGKYTNNKENDYGKLNLRFTPRDNLDISFIASKSENDNGAHDWAKAGQNDNVKVYSNFEGYSKPTIDNYSLHIDYDINKNTKITSTTAKRVHKDKASIDADLTAASILHMYRDYKFDTLSQELKLENNFGKTKLITGVYLDKEEDDIYLKTMTMLDPTGSNSMPQDLSSKSYSFFTNIETPISDKFSINTGLRYDYEKKDIDISNSNIYLEDSFKDFSPKFSLIYDIDKNSSTYFTISKGYRSGGFNPFAPTNAQKVFEEESLISYEIGYKSFLFDNLLFNSSIYYMDIDDMQVQLMNTSGNAYMTNAAKATSKGLELELQAFINDNLTLFASGSLNDTSFDEYKDSSSNYKGKTNPFAPKYNFNIALQYKDLNGVFARVDLNGYGKTYFDAANTNYQKAYEIVNAKIGYETEDYEIYLYGKNIFDEKHNATNAYMNGTTTVYYDDQEIGINLVYKF